MYSRLTSFVKEAETIVPYYRHMDGMGNRIRILRESKRLTQSALAKQVGVTRAAIAQWEASDHVDIKLQPWLKLLEVLSADPHWIVFGPSKLKPGTPRQNADHG